jgi:hypothetical protein
MITTSAWAYFSKNSELPCNYESSKALYNYQLTVDVDTQSGMNFLLNEKIFYTSPHNKN